MLRRSWTVCAMTALLLGGSAAAQSPGTLLVGGFGTWTKFDSNLNLDTSFGSSWGYGGRVGAFIAPSWNLEADGWYTPAKSLTGSRFLGSPTNAAGGDVKASAFTARLMYNFPLGNMPSIHLGAGGVLENYRGGTDTGRGTYQFGANGLIGFNLGFGGVALRVDGLVNFLPSNGGLTDFGAQAGLQFSPDLASMFGGTTGTTTMWAPYVWWDDMAAPLPGTVELGGFAQWTWFDNNAGHPPQAIPKDGLGYGGRLGVFLSDPRWEIEGLLRCWSGDSRRRARLCDAAELQLPDRQSDGPAEPVHHRCGWNSYELQVRGWHWCLELERPVQLQFRCKRSRWYSPWHCKPHRASY
jgi:hypothetical protein